MSKQLTLCRNFCNCPVHLTCVRALSFDQRKWEWKNFEPKAGKQCSGYIAEGKELDPIPLPLMDQA